MSGEPHDPSLEDLIQVQKRRLTKFVAKSIRGDHAAVEDVIQAAWLAFVERWPRYKLEVEPSMILFGMASNKVADWKRIRKRREEREEFFEEDTVVPLRDDCVVGTAAEVIDIERALDRLPDRQGEAVRKHYLEQATIREVAEQMGITVHGAKKNVADGKKNLRNSCDLNGYGHSTGEGWA